MSVADIAVIGIVLLSGLVAFSLGFVRVVLALAGWVGAAFATLYGFRYARPYAREWISVGFLADAAAGVAIFLATLFVLTVISHAIGRRVRASGLSALDRSVGLLAGLGIGGVLAALAYVGVLMIDRPHWVAEAKTRPLLEWGAARLHALVPEEWRGPVPAAGGQDGSLAVPFDRLVAPVTKPPARRAKEGYTDQQRREMDRLIRGQN